MNIIIVRSNPVKPDSRVEKEAYSLLKDNHNVEIIAWDRAQKYDVRTENIILGDKNTSIHRIGIKATFNGGFKKNIIPLIQFQLSLLKWFENNHHRFDVIHACDFDTAFISSKIAKKYKLKLVYDIFDYYVDAYTVPSKLKFIIEKLDQNVMKNSDATIICSEERIQQIKNAKPKRLTVIHNSPPKIANTSSQINSKKIKVVYVGILQKDRLIEELTEYIASDQDFELHIGGFGKLEEYLKKMERNHSNIIFYGRIPYSKTLEIENSSDIITALYNPNNRNNFYAAPNKFYEALMLGKPIMMVKNTGMSEVIRKNNLGEIIEYSREGVKDGLLKLKERSSEWNEISKKMKRIYDEEYSWQTMELRLWNLYRDL